MRFCRKGKGENEEEEEGKDLLQVEYRDWESTETGGPDRRKSELPYYFVSHLKVETKTRRQFTQSNGRVGRIRG